MSKVLTVFAICWLFLAGGVPVSRAADPVQQAIAWLHTQQLGDGSFGLIQPDGSGVPSASVTADAIYALALAGEDPAGTAWTRGGQSALDALAKLAPGYVFSDAGQAGKVARAAALAGGDPRAFGGLNLVGIIRAAYDSSTGRYHPELLFRHTLAVEGLLRAGEPVPPAAIDALLAAQRPDGSWFWAFEGDKGDVDSTGRVLQLLAGQAGLRCSPILGRAAAYLESTQEAAGWGVMYTPGPINANSTALAVAGLRTGGYDVATTRSGKSGRGALEMLLAFQEPDGAFVYSREPGREESRLMATLDALVALAGPAGEQAPCRWLYLPMRLAQGF
jgi:hypothetical protein